MYGVPPGGPPRSSKTGLVILLAVVGVVVVVGGLVATLQGGDDRSPEETVRALWEASGEDDCPALVDLLTEDSWPYLTPDAILSEDDPEPVSREAAIDDCESEEFLLDELGTLRDVRVVDEDDDRVTVEAELAFDGEDHEEELFLVREGGRWKVDVAELFE
jgi:hypothetical protein